MEPQTPVAAYRPVMSPGRSRSGEPEFSRLLNNVDRGALRKDALEGLRSAITSGRYRAGDDLGQVELAQHLGASRGTVRQALRHL